jgi:hypothetical protein
MPQGTSGLQNINQNEIPVSFHRTHHCFFPGITLPPQYKAGGLPDKRAWRRPFSTTTGPASGGPQQNIPYMDARVQL